MAKTPKTLTASQRAAYVRNGYAACPYCKNRDIVGDSLEVDGNQVVQDVSCSACERTWTDVYTLTGIEEKP